jgi:hypothetical protein
MSYSVNPIVVHNSRALLKKIEKGQEDWWECEPDPQSTRKFAYKIREALYCARRHPSLFPKLAKSAELFSIVEAGDGRVEAKFKAGKTASSGSTDTPTHGLEPQGKAVPTVGMHNAEQIIQSWKDHLPSNDALHFTQTNLDEIQLASLYEWTRTWQPKLMILVGDQTLTVSLYDPSVKEFTWRPTLAAAEPEEFDL